MNKIYNDLRKNITASNCDISQCLREAHYIASKLNDIENDKWIQWELNGYSNYDDIPDYREIVCQIKAYNPYNGWIPVYFKDANKELEETLSKKRLFDSIDEIQSYI